MNRDYPLSCALRVDSNDGEHVQVSVFVGPEGARAHSGHLTFKTAEWIELVGDAGRMGGGPGGRIAIEFEVLAPLIIKYVTTARGRHPAAFDGVAVDRASHDDDVGAEINEREIGR